MWKVNDALFWGKRNVELAWWKGIAKAHEVVNRARTAFREEIPKEFSKMLKLPMRLFSLFFGKKSMKTSYEVDYHREVAKDFWNEVMSKYYVKSK